MADNSTDNGTDNSMTIEGTVIPFERRRIDIDQVQYYLDNPRINYIVSRYPSDAVTPELVERALLALDSTRELIRDIQDNGGLIDPVVVYQGYVIEGNTRLCAYRRLHKKNPEDERWCQIDANVIVAEISTRQIFAVLSNYHIRGKTPWDAYEKAACIRRMLDQGQPIEEVARIVRSTRPRIERMMKAYDAMREKYLPKIVHDDQTFKDQDEIRKYSYFDAFYTDKELSKRAENTPSFLDEFTAWVLEGRLPKAENVRELNGILSNKRARGVFEDMPPKSAFVEAKHVLHENRPEKADPFYRQIAKFRQLIREADVAKVKNEVSKNPSMKFAIERCFRDFRKFCKEINVEDRRD